jgi:hypothetical protein
VDHHGAPLAQRVEVLDERAAQAAHGASVQVSPIIQVDGTSVIAAIKASRRP